MSRDRIDDILWLINSGESVTSVTRRLDLNADSVARSLNRNGRGDLARPFWSAARAARRQARR